MVHFRKIILSERRIKEMLTVQCSQRSALNKMQGLRGDIPKQEEELGFNKRAYEDDERYLH